MANRAYRQQRRTSYTGSVTGATAGTSAGVNCVEAGSNPRMARGRDIAGCTYPLPHGIPNLKLAVPEITNAVDVNHSRTSIEPEQWPQRGEKVSGEVVQSCNGVQEHVSCTLAHDLLNEIAAIVGLCDLLVSDQTDQEREAYVQRLRVTARQMADMVNQRSCNLMLYAPGARRSCREGFAEEGDGNDKAETVRKQQRVARSYLSEE